MRITSVYSFVVWAILCQRASADEPPAPSQTAPSQTAASQSATAVPVSVEPRATQPAAEKGAAIDAEHKPAPEAASTVINPGVTVVGSKPDLTPAEKQLIAKGYKLEVRHGEKYFCRREQQLGSRFEVKTCDTAQSIESHRLESQEAVRVIQSDRPLSNH